MAMKKKRQRNQDLIEYMKNIVLMKRINSLISMILTFNSSSPIDAVSHKLVSKNSTCKEIEEIYV